LIARRTPQRSGKVDAVLESAASSRSPDDPAGGYRGSASL